MGCGRGWLVWEAETSLCTGKDLNWWEQDFRLGSCPSSRWCRVYLRVLGKHMDKDIHMQLSQLKLPLFQLSMLLDLFMLKKTLENQCIIYGLSVLKTHLMLATRLSRLRQKKEFGVSSPLKPSLGSWRDLKAKHSKLLQSDIPVLTRQTSQHPNFVEYKERCRTFSSQQKEKSYSQASSYPTECLSGSNEDVLEQKKRARMGFPFYGNYWWSKFNLTAN